MSGESDCIDVISGMHDCGKCVCMCSYVSVQCVCVCVCVCFNEGDEGVSNSCHVGTIVRSRDMDHHTEIHEKVENIPHEASS